MAKQVGEAYVKVFPNAETFHRDLREEVEKLDKSRKPRVSIDITADIENALEELGLFEQQVRESEAEVNPIRLRVVVDDSEARTAFDALEEWSKTRETTLTTHVDVDDQSLNRADGELDRFKERNDEMTIHADIDDDQIERFLRLLENKFAKMVITPKVVSPAIPVQNKTTGTPDVDLPDQQDMWNAVNWLPKMFDNLTKQFEYGMRRIYDPYLNTLRNLRHLSIMPYQAFKQMAIEAETLEELGQKLTDTFKIFSKEGEAELAPLRNGFAQLKNRILDVRKTLGDTFNSKLSKFKLPTLAFSAASIGKDGPAKAAQAIRLSMAQTFGGMSVDFDDKFLKPLKSKMGPVPGIIGGALQKGFSPLVKFNTLIDKSINDPIRRVAASAGQKLGDGINNGVVKRLGGLQTAISSRITGTFAKMGDRFGTMFSRTFITRTRGLFTRGMGRIMTSPVLYSGIRAMYTRIGNLVGGGLQASIGAFMILGRTMSTAVLPALGAVVAGIGVLAGQAMIGGILALGGAIKTVAQGAMLMVPALVAAGGVSFAALKIGLKDVGTAVKSAFSAETVEDFENAIKDMPAAVQEVARAFRGFKPQIDEMKTAVQTKMLEGLAPGIESALNNLLPAFSNGLQRVAGHWNNAFQLALQQLSSQNAGAGLETIMSGVADMAKAMEPTLANLIAAFGSLAEQGAKFLGPLGGWINDVSAKFLNWAESLKAIDPTTGLSKFDTMIKTAQTNARHLGDIFGGMFSTLGNILHAAQSAGGGLLAGMATNMQALAHYTSEGQQGFAEISKFMNSMAQVTPLLGQLLQPVLTIVTSIGTTLANLGAAALPGIISIAEALSTAFQSIVPIATEFGTNIGNALGTLVPFIQNLGNILAPVLLSLSSGIGSILSGLGSALEMIITPMQNTAAAIGPVLEQVGAQIGNILVAAAPIVGGMFDMLSAMSPVLEAVITKMGELVMAVLGAIAPIMKTNDEFFQKLASSLVPAVESFFNIFIGAMNILSPIISVLAQLFYQVMSFLSPLLPLITGILGVMVAWSGVLKVVAVAASALSVVVSIFSGIAGAVRIVMTVLGVLSGAVVPALTAAWTALSTAFAASPLGWIVIAIGAVIAALVLFFTKTETGRQLWQTFCNIMKVTWDVLCQALKAGWDWLYENVIAWFMRKWEEAKIVFSAIMLVIKMEWDRFTQKLRDGWNWIDSNVIQPFKQAMDVMKIVFRMMCDHARNEWSNLSNKLSSVWNSIKTGVFDTFKNALETLKSTFTRITDGIKSIWNGLKTFLQDPVRFFIETVYNKGIAGPWNKVASAVGMNDKQLPLMTVPGFKTGGYVRGPGGTKGDKIPALLSDKEYVINAEAVKKIGVKNLDALNGGDVTVAKGAFRNERMRRSVLQDATFQKIASRYAGGGIVKGSKAWSQLKRGWDWAKSLSGRPYVLGGDPVGGGGTDCSGYMSSIADKIQGGAGHRQWATMAFNGGGNTQAASGPQGFVAGLAPGFSIGVTNGGAAGGHTAGTLGGVEGFPATNVESGGSPSRVKFGPGAVGADNSYFRTRYHLPLGFDGGFVTGGAGGGGFIDVGALVANALNKMLDETWNGITGPIRDMIAKYNSFGQMVFGGGADKMKEWAWERIKKWAREQATKLLDLFGLSDLVAAGGDVDVSGISGGTREVVQEVFARHGWTGKEWEDAQWIIGKESGWQVNATNPSSGAYGLFQFNPMGGNTLGTYLPDRSSDPAVQANAGAKYIKDRYGSPSAARAFWEKNGWYDQGGEGLGRGLMLKNVLSPERVLSPGQTRAFNDFVYSFLPALIESWRKDPMRIANLFVDLQAGFKRIENILAEEREVRITNMSAQLQREFADKIAGKENPNKVDFEGLTKAENHNLPYMQQWWGKNGQKLINNIGGAFAATADVTRDPDAYLEAEKRALEAIDKAENPDTDSTTSPTNNGSATSADVAVAEAEATTAQAEATKAQSEATTAQAEASEAKAEAATAQAEAAEAKTVATNAAETQKATDAEKVAVQQEKITAEKKEQTAEKKEQAAATQVDQAEKDRIQKLKESGEYYYGYAVYKNDGTNPKATQETEEEKQFKKAGSAFMSSLGLGSVAEKAIHYWELGREINDNVQTAMPAWYAAANGDYTGLKHNAAVAASVAYKDANTEALNLLPTAISDLTEAIVASGTKPTAYFENVYTGMSKAEFNQAIDERMAAAARRGGGGRPR